MIGHLHYDGALEARSSQIKLALDTIYSTQGQV